MASQISDRIRGLIEADDVSGVSDFLDAHAGNLRAMMPGDCSPLPLIAAVRSNGMADALLSRGLTVEMLGEWWAPGFGLSGMLPAVAEYFIGRGAAVTAHAAAALGLTARLGAMLEEQPDLVRAKGGDGCAPLHFSRDVETARLLVSCGAELDARDDDHDSTPAQWRIGEAPEVTRFLIGQGARADIFMAAALNDRELAGRLIEGDPACTSYRIGHNSGPFPGLGFRGRGGTIYQWTLGFNQSPQEIAFRRGHVEMYQFLMTRTPPRFRFLVACMLADRPLARQLIAEHPGLTGELDEEDRSLLAKCCWETNLNVEAVRLMLDIGFPVDAPEFTHGFQPLHNAAWCGNPELAKLLIGHGHPVDRRDPCYHSTPLGFAIHSCVVALRHPEGDFPEVARLLLNAGAPLDAGMYPSGNDGLDAVLKSFV
ncbi:MAG TPA: ankyrin repeat domain-containing protein [Verrucomicrobiales bacterium]|jgi:ankyrin repeat protein|nr:ankyrin repeat domain-containing protein [Verrucomicrobiales bacterium]